MPPKPLPARPNVLILYTDDQGYGDAGAFNPQAKLETPRMDQLAREGLVLTDGHSPGSVCTPSRYGLLTRRYPWRTELGGGVLGADAPCLIQDSETTIASLAREHGYATAIFGKWHLGMEIEGVKGERDWSAPVVDGPLQKGFDTFYGLPASMNYGVLTWFHDDRATEPASLWTRKKFPDSEIETGPLQYRMTPPFDPVPAKPSDVEVAPSFEDSLALKIIAERTIEYLEHQGSQPFMVYVPLTSPHLPHCTAPEFRGRSAMGNYGDFMLETDHRVGQILDALERLGLAENTLVLLTSDNGPENNYRDWQRLYRHESNGGFRGGKRDVYEGGHRVPFIVRWPGVVAAGRRSDALVSQVDVLATLAEILDGELGDGQGEDSLSLLPILAGASNAAQPRESLIQFGRGRFAARYGRWKLIYKRSSEGPRALGEPAELYDLDADPGESINLLESQPEMVTQVHARAVAAMKR